MSLNTFETLKSHEINGQSFNIFNILELRNRFEIDRLPISIRIFLENLLRHEDGFKVTKEQIEALARYSLEDIGKTEIAFSPERVLMQDLTGIPAIVDLAALRDAVFELGGNLSDVNPRVPVELVVDHSVIVDFFGKANAYDKNVELEYSRNFERYELLKWAQNSFRNLKIVPPGTGICHQVNLEYLARVVMRKDNLLYFDTLVGTDSHTTMINGLGVLGWGVGGIEAEAAMLGEPTSFLIPEVIGVEITGELPVGATATDIVLRVAQMLRQYNVVGKIVEFYGESLHSLSVETRATISNMSPEYGATSCLFPIDERTLEYLELTGREKSHIDLVRSYVEAQGLFFEKSFAVPEYRHIINLNLSEIEPSVAGPSRPQDRITLNTLKHRFGEIISGLPRKNSVFIKEGGYELKDGDVVIAAITSCTNTSNPSVMLGAGILAKKAVERGLKAKPWVKTSLAPGSRVVSDYLEDAGLTRYLEKLGFYTVGYGCTTCIGNSGPLNQEISAAIKEGALNVSAVLSGNRNFEGRIHPEVKFNFLTSPPLVVAFAIAGTLDIDFETAPLGVDESGSNVYLRDIWPREEEIQQLISSSISREKFISRYSKVFEGDKNWAALQVEPSERFNWNPKSTYIRRPPFFDNIKENPKPPADVIGARILLLLGNSVTTDHISPAGFIRPDSPAGRYLTESGVSPQDFNSYGSRRGNHEVMVRGTFANSRLKNKLADGKEGGFTKYFPHGEITTVFDAANKYSQENVPLVIFAGKEYGSGSSRDWAAKGVSLLGVKAVIVESIERIHRSNLVEMGILPLVLRDGLTLDDLNLKGDEVVNILAVKEISYSHIPKELTLEINGRQYPVTLRIDTEAEALYYLNGSILRYIARELAK